MKSGRLNKFITIEELKTITNEYGEEEQSLYCQKFRTRTEVKNEGGTRENDNGEIFYSSQLTFIVWAYCDKKINDFDRIIYQNKPYRILNKELVEEDKILYIKAEQINE